MLFSMRRKMASLTWYWTTRQANNYLLHAYFLLAQAIPIGGQIWNNCTQYYLVFRWCRVHTHTKWISPAKLIAFVKTLKVEIILKHLLLFKCDASINCNLGTTIHFIPSNVTPIDINVMAHSSNSITSIVLHLAAIHRPFNSRVLLT